MNTKYVKEVFLIINHRRLEIIKEIKQQFLKFNIAIKIYSKDDSLKSILSQDTIVILDNELMLDHQILSLIEHLVLRKRAIHLFKLPDVDVEDLLLFFQIGNSYPIKVYNPNQERFFIDLIFSLKVFKSAYCYKNRTMDRICAQDPNFIKMLDCLINHQITIKEKVLEVVPISTKEFSHYETIFKSLYIYDMTQEQIKEFLPVSFQKIFIKKRDRITINDIFNKLYFMIDELTITLSNMSIIEFNNQFDQLLNAIKNNSFINNTLVVLFNQLGLIRIIDGEIKNLFKEKELFSIKQYLENKFIKKEQVTIDELKDTVYLNYCKDHRLNLFNDYHKTKNIKVVNSLQDADIVVSLVTTKAVIDSEFNKTLLDAVKLNKKILVIYLDKCNLSIHMQYHVKYADDMCYWSYKRYDVFFERYFEYLNKLSKEELRVKHYVNALEIK